MSFKTDLVCGLSLAPKRVPSKYLWDARASKLYAQLCAEPDYTLARAELEILRRHGPALAAVVGERFDLVDLGCGDGSRARQLLSVLRGVGLHVAVDLEREQLGETAAMLRGEYPRLFVQPLCADFSEPLVLPERRPGERLVLYLGGSLLGTLTRAEAHMVIERLANLVRPTGGLLLGVDLKKDPVALHRAYNDERGFMAALNSNLLVRAGREVGARFCLDQFKHYAYYEPDPGRVVFTLVSTARQTVSVGSVHVDFDEGEPLVTGVSYKYSPASLERFAVAAGLRPRALFQDVTKGFALAYFEA